MVRALIIGGGPAGLATALALRSVGFTATVFEKSDYAAQGTGLTLWPNAFAALATFDADKPVRALGKPAEGNQIRNSAGRVLDDVHPAAMRERFGGTGVALLRSDLVETLLELLGSVRTPARCTGFHAREDRVVATFADGAEEEGDLLIGADGLHSVVRATLHGASAVLRYAGYAVWRGVTRYPLGPFPGLLTMGAGAQFGLFGLHDGLVYWFASTPMPEGRATMLPALAYLRTRFDGWHNPIGNVLDAAVPDDVIVTDIYDGRPLPFWSRGRVTLVGDAAHPSTPNLGQGTCQAFEDAAVLANCLNRHDIPEALRRYENARRRRADSMTRQARRLGDIGKWRHPVACWLRDQLIARSPSGPRTRQLRRMLTFLSG